MISILEDIKKIKSGRKELSEFGITMGVVFSLFAGFALWRGRASFLGLLACGVLFIVFGLVFPTVLKPLQKIWMAFAAVMGFVMSRLILAVLFFGVITPISLIMRISGKDLLDERIARTRPSYWHERPEVEKNKESYENQY